MKLTERDLAEIKQLSERCGVRELILFGSAQRAENLGPKSDIDLAVSFREPKARGRFTAFMDLKEQLEELFQRSVDLVSTDSIRNPVFRDELQKSGSIIYATSA